MKRIALPLACLLVGLLAGFLLAGTRPPDGPTSPPVPLPSGAFESPQGPARSPRPLPAGVLEGLQAMAPPCCARAGRVNEVELELLRRFASGQGDTIPGDLELANQVVRATTEHAPCLVQHSPYPALLWLGLFDPDVLAAVRMEQSMRPGPFDLAACDYLTRTLDAPWSLACSLAERNNRQEILDLLRPSKVCPAALGEAWALAVRGTDRPIPEAMIRPWTGILHLLGGSFNQMRGEMLSATALGVARRYRGPLRGLRLADVGTGCGLTLPWYLRAVGDSGRVYAIELDPFVLHVARHVVPGPVQAVVCPENSIQMPERSLDLVVMTGVHMGAGLGERYEAVTLPWLRSMRSALSPKGLLIVDEAIHGELVAQDLTGKIERAGFRQVAFLTGAEHPRREPDGFVAVFEVVK